VFGGVLEFVTNNLMAKFISERTVGLIAAVCLFVIIFMLMPSFVGGTWHVCRGNGYRNATDGLCTCITGYHGANCEYQYCPFGKSWLSPPLESDVRNRPLVPCSNMGYCDPLTGTCECRPGYEGRACERLVCPGAITVTTKTAAVAGLEIGQSGGGGAAFSVGVHVADDYSTVVPCAGHGRCVTLGDAGELFDGRSFIRPPVTYSNWDADSIQGCVCDEGWTGYDCSVHDCPSGRDPLAVTAQFDKNEVFVLECRASSGYFAILVKGYYTEPIPFDADPGLLKYTLESVAGVGSVTIKMPRGSDNMPKVCQSSTVQQTTIEFDDHPGSNPPIYVTLKTANTRRWPSGSASLSSTGFSEPVLRMATVHNLYCPVCVDCEKNVYFTYGTSISSGVAVKGSSAKANIQSAILSLEDLVDANWENLAVNVTTSPDVNTICSASTAVVTTIILYSSYGNIPSLSILDGSYFTSTSTNLRSANLTWTSNKGNGTMVSKVLLSRHVTCAYCTVVYLLYSTHHLLMSVCLCV
jgi:hypothetical protein